MDENKMFQTIEKLEKEIVDLKGSKLRNRFRNFFSKSFTIVHWIIGIIIVVVASSIIVYATQITFTDGTVISANEVNSNFTELYTETSELYDKTSNYSVNVYHDAAQTITNEETILFNSERFDNGDLHSTSIDTGRLIAPVDGTYLINARVVYMTTLGTKWLFITLNGTTNSIAIDQIEEGNRWLSISTIYELSANDFVLLRTGQDTGGDISISANESIEFSMVRLASN